jgi:hypothetical protein
MYVGWSHCEYGAPEIDPKRPYGNSWIEGDIHEILTGTYEDTLSDELEDKYSKLHQETETALQVVLRTGSFTPGHYRCDPPYKRNWILVDR